jgi:3-hydroxy-5-methyl-1-naphthoate 3-O-methyltransferase
MSTDTVVPTAPDTGVRDLDRLAELATGLWVTQTLVAAEGLDLFELLSSSGGATVADVARELDIDERPAEILLTACAALDLVSRDDARFVNQPIAERYLVPSSPDYFGGYIRMLSDFAFPGWMRIGDAIRTNSPTRWKEKPKGNIFNLDHRSRLFWDGLFTLSSVTARALDDALDLGDRSMLLDVGGGSAAFDIELCRRHPALRATVFDLPHVCDYATEKIAAAELSERVAVHPGDFFQDELPPGHDVILLSMILHDWDEAQNQALLCKCFDALPSGGRLVISELLVDDDKTGPLDAALMSMNMLVGTYGRNYTADEYTRWLRTAGFDDVHVRRFRAPGANGAVVARKP